MGKVAEAQSETLNVAALRPYSKLVAVSSFGPVVSIILLRHLPLMMLFYTSFISGAVLAQATQWKLLLLILFPFVVIVGSASWLRWKRLQARGW